MARPNGTPTWLEYTADGLEPSIRFYERLAGWSIEDADEISPDYHAAVNVEGRVAGMMDTTNMGSSDVDSCPPMWDVYLAVDDIGARLTKVRAAGGQVVLEPREMPGVGTFALVRDSIGCLVGLWEDGGFEGFPDAMSAGNPCWFEIMSMDVDETRRFYTEVFDVDYPAMPGDEGPSYFTNGDAATATSGLCDAQDWFPEGTQSFWRWYLAVDSADDAAALTEQLGGKVLDGPMDTPYGRVASIADPAGAILQINSPIATRSEADDANL